MDEINFASIAQTFADEKAAREMLESIRWPDGPICPHCGSTEAYALTPKPDSKRPVRPGVYKCKACRKQFTVTVGTIFEGSRIPLHKWLMAVHLMCSSKKGISAHQLHRMFGITYKSAWFMCHRIRYAMAQPPLAEKLDDTVEADEAYIGGKQHGGKRGRGSENKTPVAVLVERDGDSRAKKVENITAATLQGHIRENVEKSARIMTDEFRSYRGLEREFAGHKTVAHGLGEYVRGDAHVNTAESWIAILKRGIYGTFHHVSEKHLDRYLGEFVFRWNGRKETDSDRTVSTLRGAEGKRLYYRPPAGSNSGEQREFDKPTESTTL
jgi:transposase-like protein